MILKLLSLSTRLAVTALTASVLCLATPAAVAETQRDGFTMFTEFCIENFGAEKEPLVYETFGDELKILPEGIWIHASYTSAAIGWDTNLPAKSYVEYGTTRQYGQRTDDPERHFYVNLRHLTGLEPDTTYHYRLVSVDERGNRVTSANKTFTTAMPEGAARIPGNMEGPPFVLTEPGTYVLTQDIDADHTAIEIRGDDIVLDLNGHTITYNNEPFTVRGASFRDWVEQSAFGVLMERSTNFRMFNGTIRQGEGQSRSSNISIGTSPFHGQQARGDLEFAGLRIEYSGAQLIGINFHWSRGTCHIHHNEFVDYGSDIRNRHGSGSRAARMNDAQIGDMHHNLVKRTRQFGIVGGDRAYNNEIYVDSFSTNSIALSIKARGGRAFYNRIFATGFNPYGIAWGRNDYHVHDNFIHMEGRDTAARWGETWGDINMLCAFRGTNYSQGGQVRDDVYFYDNVAVLRGREDCELRAVEFFTDNTVSNVVFRDNIIKVEALDDETTRVAAINAQGHFRKHDSLPIVYKNNTFISNRYMVRFGDDYGRGNNHHFIDNKFIRTGGEDQFSTFYFGGRWWNFGHVIRDGQFGEGTDPLDVQWGPVGGQAWYQVEWTFTLEAAPRTLIEITDARGEVVYQSMIDRRRAISVPLVQARLSPPEQHDANAHEEARSGTPGASMQMHTPHTIKVTLGDDSAQMQVEMDQPRILVFEEGELKFKTEDEAQE